MSDPLPKGPTMPDDLDRAYAQAHALTDGEGGPAVRVRAHVLAAAQAVAVQVAARAVVPSMSTPVAAPVAAVGRGRMAVNRSSWRLRAGAAFSAALLVGAVAWRFDASRGASETTQVASAGLELNLVPPAPPQASPPKDLPPPPLSLPMPMPMPMPMPPLAADVQPRAAPVLAVPDAGPAPRPAASERAARLAMADLPLRARTPALSPDAAPASGVPPLAAAPRLAAPAAPVVVAAASQDTQRVEITGSSISRVDSPVSDAARAALEQAKKSVPAPAKSVFDASQRLLSTPLQDAADQGDAATLRRLLASPGTLVDAPDVAGRTALLHAVQAQQVEAVRLLLAAGADPGRADRTGLTPRAAALTGANAEIATLLDSPL